MDGSEYRERGGGWYLQKLLLKRRRASLFWQKRGRSRSRGRRSHNGVTGELAAADAGADKVRERDGIGRDEMEGIRMGQGMGRRREWKMVWDWDWKYLSSRKAEEKLGHTKKIGKRNMGGREGCFSIYLACKTFPSFPPASAPLSA